MMDRVLFLSHPQFHQKKLKKAICVLLNNGYPLPFIFLAIETRLKYHDHKLKSKREHNNINNRFFTVPYVKTISESFVPIASNINRKTAFSIPNTLKRFIKMGKDHNLI